MKTVLYTTDGDGRAVIGVPLTNHPGHAWLYAKEYDAIVAEFGQTPFYVNGNGHGNFYVRLRSRTTKNNKMVSRLVTGEFERTFIRHRDGNRLNLRSTTLEIEPGAGGCKKRRKSIPSRTAVQQLSLDAHAA
jgi:hypothetical protein